MKTYQAKFNPDTKNVYGVSLVESPAMEGNFIQFSKQSDIKFANVDEGKRRVMGLILEPNKLVYRNQGGQEFNIVFTEQDIEDVAYNFQKESNQNTSTIEHDDNNIQGVSFVETWIVEDSKIDKSANFGFNYPKGSWMGVMQIDNDDVWNDYVKKGSVKGFSIDAFMQLEEVNFKQVNTMSETAEKQDNVILSAIKDGFSKLKEEIGLGKKDEVVEVELKEDTEEKVELKEDVKIEFNAEDFLKQVMAELKEVLEPIQNENVALKEQLEAVETKLTKQSEELIELGKQPATTSISKKPTQVDFSKMDELAKRKYFRDNE